MTCCVNIKTLRPNLASVLVIVTLMASVAALAADPELLHNYALDLSRKGEPEKALEKLREAVSLFPYDPLLKKNLAAANIIYGRKLMERNSFSEAAERFAEASSLFPEDPLPVRLRGVALLSIKDYDGATYELERARRMEGETAELLYLLGRIRYETGDTAGGVELWEKASALTPDDPLLKEAVARGRRELSAESRMSRGDSGRFIISFDNQLPPGLSEKVLDALETAYNRVGSDISWYPTARVPVILYTRKEFREVTSSPEWSGGLYDGKIRLPVGGVTDLSDRFRAVLRHEYTHVVVQDITKGNCPVWLNEGIAENEGRKELDPPLRELGQGVREGGLIPLSRLESSFSSLSGRDVYLAYEESFSIVRYIISAYGWHKVREILVTLGTRMSLTDAITKALGDYAIDYHQLEEDWRGQLQKEYSGT